jgi:hypothetical protein
VARPLMLVSQPAGLAAVSIPKNGRRLSVSTRQAE